MEELWMDFKVCMQYKVIINMSVYAMAMIYIFFLCGFTS